MDIHKPKPWHGWPELLKEVGTIVIGVLIALGAEQTVEAIHWHHKVQASETAIKTELGNDLRWALLVKQYGSCTTGFLNTLQAAIIAGDTPTVRKLDDLRGMNNPFPAAAWSSGTYTAALGSQITDHLPDGRMAAYSREFTWVPMQVQYQFKLFDELATALTAKLGLPGTAETLDRQLTAIQVLRSDENGRLIISEAMLAYGRENLSITPSNSALIASNAAQAKDCEARLLAIQGASKH